MQSAAEKSYQSGIIQPMNGLDSVNTPKYFSGPDTISLGVINATATIRKIAFQVSLTYPDILDSIYLDMFWDGNPYPAVHVSFGDLFAALSWPRNNSSRYIRSNSSGSFMLEFPMPFARKAEIRLGYAAHQQLWFGSQVYYQKESIDPSTVGYFYTQVHRSDPTKYHVNHPVLHTLGRGRYIGMILQMPTLSNPSALEGDPIFTVDSNPAYSFRLTGTEDYFDGGNYFAQGQFSLPFAGCLVWPGAMYRFHVLDAIDFDSSFDLDLQHGYNTDVHEDYRTVAFYYKHQPPFWCPIDTVLSGRRWEVRGTGYEPTTPIEILLDGIPAGTTTAAADGTFEWTGIVQANSSEGKHFVSVNNEIQPSPLYIIKHPAIRLLVDTLPVILQEGTDTLAFTCTGFNAKSNIQLFLDTVSLRSLDTIDIGSDQRFNAKILIPLINEGIHHLIATDGIDTAICQIPIEVTHTRNYEFERLLPSVVASDSLWKEEVVSYWNWACWGEQAVVDFEPLHAGDSISFNFFVPETDSFRVLIFATTSPSAGNYSYSIDGSQKGIFIGYPSNSGNLPIPSDTLDAGTLTLSAGLHSCTFHYLNREASTTDSLLIADHLVLVPKRSVIDSAHDDVPIKFNGMVEMSIIPNPNNGSFSIQVPKSSDGTSDGIISIINDLGIVVYRKDISTPDSLQPISVNVSWLPEGSYTLAFQWDSDITSTKRNIIITK